MEQARSMASWERRISRPGAPAVPILIRRMHRIFWVPPRYRALCASTLDGRAFTLRDMGKRTGYSLKGVYGALRALQGMGMGNIRTSRGCKGRTRFVIQDDVEVARRSNVSTTVRLLVEGLSISGNWGGNIRSDEPWTDDDFPQ